MTQEKAIEILSLTNTLNQERAIGREETMKKLTSKGTCYEKKLTVPFGTWMD